MLFYHFRKKKKDQLLCKLDSLTNGSEWCSSLRERRQTCSWSWKRLLSPLFHVVKSMMLAELPVKGYPVFNDCVTKLVLQHMVKLS